MIVARRFIVIGSVQGVGFRYFAIRAAQACGVVGTVRNLGDGSVEAIAEGATDSIACFRREMERGPSYSRVEKVEEWEMQPTGRYKGFEVVF